MEQKGRICQVGDHLAEELGAFGVVIGQRPKASLQAATLFAGVKQSEIKVRKPLIQALKGFGQIAAGSEVLERLLNWLPVRGSRRMALELLQRDDNGQAGGSELAELVIKISPPRELCRGEGKGHSSRHAIEAGFKIAFALEADDLLGDLALAEKQKRGDGADAVF